MRIKIGLEPHIPLTLSIHHGPIIQGLIYSQLEPNLAHWLHGEAYRTASRTYRMFTFSRLHGDAHHHRAEKRLTFTGPVSFQLASHNTQVLCSLAEHLLKENSQRLGSTLCTVTGIEISSPPKPDFAHPVRVRTLSPITTYSTFATPEGRKKTYYYDPHERDFGEQLKANLTRKAAALGWEEDAGEALANASITPHRVGGKDQRIVYFKGSFVKAWSGVYEMKLPEPYFWLAYDTGLGAKNAQGLGMVEVVG